MQYRLYRNIIVAIVLVLLASASAGAQSNHGEVQIYVFSQIGLPVEGVQVDVDGRIFTSNTSGLINFTYPPGTHDFTLTLDGTPVARVEVPVRQARATEIIVTLREQSSEADVEAAAEESAEQAADEITSQPRAQLDSSLPSGQMVGTVTHIETGEPISNVTVIFRGVDFETTTNAAGEFAAEVPEGEYSIALIHPDFSTRTVDAIVVVAEESVDVSVQLTPAAFELPEVAVMAADEVIVQGGIANLIDETRNSGVVLNLIGSEQISRAGDSDAAGALSRVTGLTVVGGKFVYVRGMGERYSSSLLNDARLPSPEPDRRVVPLDLFPTSVIESIAVQKSYSPELPGDFGGGAISIRTIGIPDDQYDRRLRTKISGSVAYNQGTTFTERLVDSAGSLDFLGFDDGSRRMPDEYSERDLIEAGIGEDPLTQEEVDALGRLLPNTWDAEPRTIPIDYGMSASVRDKVTHENGGSVGYNIAALYSNSWHHDVGAESAYTIGTEEYIPLATYVRSTTAHDIDLGAIADVTYESATGNSLESTSLLIRATDSTYNTLEGYNADESNDLKFSEIIWNEQMLLSQGLGTRTELGVLNGASLSSRYVFSLAQRYVPDTRETYEVETLPGSDPDNSYDPEAARVWTQQKDDNQRTWTTVRDFVHDAEVSLEIPVFLFGRSTADYIDTGLYGMYQSRGTDIRRFGFYSSPGVNPQSDELFHTSPGEVFTPDNIGDEVRFSEETFVADNYSGYQVVGATYATADVLLPADMRLNAGTRLEFSRQAVSAYDEDPSVLAERTWTLDDLAVLPAANLTIPTGDASQFRISASRTVNRPDLRELSPSPFYGPPGFAQFNGNPDLAIARLWNADARWETYVSLDESFSIGAFYKYFVDPIEIIRPYGAAAGGERFPINIPNAYNLGAELEWALQMRFVSNMLRGVVRNTRSTGMRRFLGGVGNFMRDVRTTGNVALIRSRVDYGGQTTYKGANLSNTTTDRALTGQAPYVVNAALGYKNDVSYSLDLPVHTSAFFNYNVVGPYISELGTASIPDQYQQPVHELDLVLRQQIGYVFSVSAEVGNILDPPSLVTLGRDRSGQIVSEERRGRTFSLGVTLDF